MTKEPFTITIDPDSELGRALDEPTASRSSCCAAARVSRVIREAEDPWATYDPAKLRAGLMKVAGLLSPEEGDRIIETIYRGREEGTRPITRP